jgi:Ca-activated chloride channel homolog
VIEFLWPWMFLLLPLPLLVRHFLAPAPRPDAALTVPDANRFRTQAERGPQLTRWRGPLIILALAWLLLVTGAARPVYIGDAVALEVSGRDLMLAVDLSGSMNIEDMRLGERSVNRLDAVKAVVGDFLERRRGDRVGLILFGTSAYLQAPLTFDTTTVHQLLAESTVGLPGGRTAIGDAIGLAVKHLMDRPGETKVLILLTDGANNSGQLTPELAARIAAMENVRIHAVGVGASDVTRRPAIFGNVGRFRNPATDIDEDVLRRVTDITGGRYFMAQNTEELEEIYHLLDQLEPIDEEVQRYRPIQALFHWPLAGALVLYGFALVLVPRVTTHV